MAFEVGDVLYDVTKAKGGICERIVVKTVRPIVSRRPIEPNRFLYVDTLNGLWNEWDLVPYEQAQTLVAAYGAT